MLASIDPTEVDPRATLPDDTKINNLPDLKKYLLEQKKDQFSETIVRKVLAYVIPRREERRVLMRVNVS